MDKSQLLAMINHQNPEPDRVPTIPLYMDQVLSYLDNTLRPLEPNLKEPCFTKTMINNYVKSGVIKAPDKKKYDQYHLMTMTMLYRLKKSLSLTDIEVLTKDQSPQAVANRYQHFLEIERGIGNQLRDQLEGQLLEDGTLETLTPEALQAQILTLAVEADAKMRLAQSLVALYKQQVGSKP